MAIIAEYIWIDGEYPPEVEIKDQDHLRNPRG